MNQKEHLDELKYQNDLINQRLTWMGAFEGLLFVADHNGGHPYLIAMVGLLIAISTGIATQAANAEISRLRGQAYGGWRKHLMPGKFLPLVVAITWIIVVIERLLDISR